MCIHIWILWIQGFKRFYVFIGEPAVLDSYEYVEITSNKVVINEETSEVKNIQLFTNSTDEGQEIKIRYI